MCSHSLRAYAALSPASPYRRYGLLALAHVPFGRHTPPRARYWPVGPIRAPFLIVHTKTKAMAGIIAPFEKVVGESAQTTARITRIRFVSPDKTYAVVDAVTRKRMSFTMVGSLASFKVDDEVRVKGVWMASKYGTQLRVTSCEIVLQTPSVGSARFLS